MWRTTAAAATTIFSRAAAVRSLSTKVGGPGKGSAVKGGSKKTSLRAPPSPVAAAAATPPPPAPSTTPPPPPTVSQLARLHPHVDVVRYTHQNRTWTLSHVDYYSTAVAQGLLDQGFVAHQTTLLSWLPAHFAEQMVLQFACAKAGFVLYSLDPVTHGTPEDLATALTVTAANVVIVPEAYDDVNYVRRAQVAVPETRIFDLSEGQPFVSPRFPHLRQCVHTGFDQDQNKHGFLPLRQLVVPLPPGTYPLVENDSTPLCGEWLLDPDTQAIRGVTDAPLTAAQLRQRRPLWPTYQQVLDQQYHVVDGVGVMF